MPFTILADIGQKYTTHRDPATGLHRTELRIDDVRLPDAGQWRAVDESLITDGQGGFSRQQAFCRHLFRSADNGTRRWHPRRDHPGEYVEFGIPQYWTGATWATLPMGTPAVTGNLLTWDRPTYAVRVQPNWHQVKLEVLLKTSGAARRIRWPMSLSNLGRSGWGILGQDGSVVGRIGQPWAEDANGVRYDVTASIAGGYVGFVANLTGATFPVVIDPTLTLQQGTDGYSGAADTEMLTPDPTGNYSTLTWLGVGDLAVGSSSSYRNILRFALTGLPTSAVVNATSSLQLYEYACYDEATVGSWAVALRRLLRDWVPSQATWNIWKTSNNWTTPGAGSDGNDRAAADTASVTLDGTPAGAFISWTGATLADDIQRMLAGTYGTYGWLLQAPGAEAKGNLPRVGNFFYSADYATDPTKRPLLLVEFSLPIVGRTPFARSFQGAFG